MTLLREVAMSEISLELVEGVRGETPLASADPIVVIEDAGRLYLVDGLKRFFSGRAAGGERVWAIVRGASRVEGILERLRRNNPRRRTTLGEELDLLAALRRESKLSERAIAGALERRTRWVRERFELLEKLRAGVGDALGERLFRPSIALGIARLEREEQLRAAFALSEARLSLRDAGRFLRALAEAEAPARARYLGDPRALLTELASAPVDAPTSSPLSGIPALLSDALRESAGDDPE